ncbi:MAG: ABC transporter permease [Firmicutes bacterium]|nr:ABC transporter permease [Bacillota bacterium]
MSHTHLSTHELDSERRWVISVNKNDFNYVESSKKLNKEQIRPSLTYWKDAWRRLKKNKMAMAGMIGVLLIVAIAIFGPMFSKYNYSDQITDFSNTPPRMEIYQIEEGTYVFLSAQYRLFIVTDSGEIIERLDQTDTDIVNRIYTYDNHGEPVYLDYSYRLIPDSEIDFKLTYKGVSTTEQYDKVWNTTFLLGSDNLGRDVLTRVMYGARISLTVALVATIVNLFIGVTYGAFSGLEGGKIDNIMMRIVDIINSIPLLLYVILLMVIIDDRGLWTIIITLGSIYWVGMARLVRGQVLGLKEQEYVLAARTIGVRRAKIISRHLIPNAMGPILVSMTMMIPTAVFTESFLSFIGLGISAPQASWGTLANDALSALSVYPYQLMIPSLAIALTMLSFNFLGDGLRSALDPRLRKG